MSEMPSEDGSMPIPPVIRIEPASACNLRCLHCPTGVVDMTRRVMRQATFDRVLEQLPPHVPPVRVVVMYHGGEPFLNKHFLDMVEKVKASGVPLVKTVSNGMLVKEALWELVVTSGLDSIEISLDGTSPEENDAIRRSVRYPDVVRNIRGLVETKRRLGADIEIHVATTQFRKLDGFQPDQEAPVPEYLQREFADIVDEINFKTTWAMLWPSEQPAEGYDLLWMDETRAPVTSCNLIEETMTIRADGSVVPCCFDLTSELVIGNINEQGLEDIWNGERFRRLRRAFNAGIYPKVCANCVIVTGDKYLLQKKNLTGQQQLVRYSELTASRGEMAEK